jgi:3-oxoacyl-(acyl-carrier-protein) synthase
VTIKHDGRNVVFHEFAHQAAVQFFKDAAHELASDALRADARIFERWLGMEEGALALTREQQEKFATGMEQFLLTGEAPTKQLEGAFAKIKAWMQSIYQTVTELGTPIPDEVREALKRIVGQGLAAESVSYIEAHGSGTPVGDPIEIMALTKAFRTFTQRSGYCAIGSVKTNVGHLDAAAGIAGIRKKMIMMIPCMVNSLL